MEQLNILQTHVLRLNHHQNQTRSNLDENTINTLNITNSKLSMDCINIKFDEDINFHLLRHWSLYDSICHTHEMILSFKLWSSRGQSQLKEFLADLGIPKREYEQNYRDMNIKYKLNIKKQILDKRLQDKYHYTSHTIILPTFLLTSGFTLKLSPQDIVYSLMATLQTSSSSSTSTSNSMMIDLTERFSLALSCLNCHQLKDYLNGIEFEKIYMSKIHYLIESLLQSDKNLSFDHTIPFILLKFDQNMFNSSTTTDHTTSCGFFTHPYQAYLFARNALQILISYTSLSTNVIKKKKSKYLQRLPLILIAPYSLTNSGQELVEIVVGVPALNSIMMNSFSTLFEAADRRCGNVAKFVFFDHSVLLLQEQHQQKFIDALMFVLAK
jgi:cell division control protein 45